MYLSLCKLLLRNFVNVECSFLAVVDVYLCQLTYQTAGIMSSLCGVYVRVHLSDFSSKTTRPRDMQLLLKDSLVN